MDIIRGIVALFSIVFVLALLSEPTVHFFVPKLLFFAGLTVVCIATARDRRGVVVGVIAIFISRLLIGGTLLFLKNH